MPIKQKQKQSQNVNVVVNLTERKKRRRKSKRLSKMGANKQPIKTVPNISINSSFQHQQAPTIPHYPRYINAPAPAYQPYSIQELRKVFLENMGQQTPSAETPLTPLPPTPIQAPEPTPTSSVEEPIAAPEEAPVEEVKALRVRRTKAEKEEAIGMGLDDPNPLRRKKAEGSALKRMGEQFAIQQGNMQGNLTSPLGQRVADIYRRQQKGKDL